MGKIRKQRKRTKIGKVMERNKQGGMQTKSKERKVGTGNTSINLAKKPSKENEEKISKRLSKLGFTMLPAKSTLDGLECLWSELETLVAGCAENLASSSP